MTEDQQIWREWARIIHRWGAQGWVATFLEAAGPLTIFGAQAVYIGQPLLHYAFPPAQLNALSRLLEDPVGTEAFINFLREENSS